MSNTRILNINLVLAALNVALWLWTGCGDNTELGDPLDAAVVDTDAQVDAGIDAPVDADIDAELATHPPFPMPSPCDTCVGFGCDQVCADAGVDAP